MSGTAGTSSSPRILTVNGGSSSIKFALFEAGSPPRRVVSGAIAGIGSADARFEVQGRDASDQQSRAVQAPDHTAAVDELMAWVAARRDSEAWLAVGHRFVHGGPHFGDPQRIVPGMLDALHELSPLDPEHMPQALRLAEAFRHRFPQLDQVACFDTAFHRHMPRVAQMLPIPRRYEASGVRRYGFHGLSYTSLLSQLTQLHGNGVAHGRVVLAHLGNGASLAAVRGGRAMDTSMGFTPASGVPMGSRSGDLDPGLAWHLARTEGTGAQQFNEMINTQSGLLGVSGSSADMRVLLERESTDVRAAEAVALFCYHVRKCIGAFAAALGGLDTLVFSAGIGENTPAVRARICAGLAFLGVELAAQSNTANAGIISSPSSRVGVYVLHTDEEMVIAEATCRVLKIPMAQEHEHGQQNEDVAAD